MSQRTRPAALSMTHERAIIDIGSNTVRMVIFGGPARAPVVLHNEKVMAKLGKGAAENGLLSDKAAALALAALARYAQLLAVRGVQDVTTVATAAVRDSGNGAEFLASIADLGLRPRLISGEEEAEASSLGVIGAFPGAKGVVADLGGGSLELIHVDGPECDHGCSLPFGSLRLPPLRAGGPDTFGRRVKKAMETSGFTCAAGETLYLVGGSHRALARYAMHHRKWPLDDPHGFALTADEAQAVCRSVAHGRAPISVAGMSTSRAASLADTAALLSVLLREIAPADVVFSSWGLREGLAFSRLAPETRAQDPLVAGVSAFVEALGASPMVAATVAGWTSAANHPDGDGGENLRLAATMLALASQRIEPNLRADHVTAWCLRKRWIGVSAEGRAMMAACALAHCGGGQLRPAIAALAAPANLQQAKAWGSAVRLCRRLGGAAPQVMANSRLAIEDGKLVLAVRQPFDALFTETIEKELRALAATLGLEWVFIAEAA